MSWFWFMLQSSNYAQKIEISFLQTISGANEKQKRKDAENCFKIMQVPISSKIIQIHFNNKSSLPFNPFRNLVIPLELILAKISFIKFRKILKEKFKSKSNNKNIHRNFSKNKKKIWEFDENFLFSYHIFKKLK